MEFLDSYRFFYCLADESHIFQHFVVRKQLNIKLCIASALYPLFSTNEMFRNVRLIDKTLPAFDLSPSLRNVSGMKPLLQTLQYVVALVGISFFLCFLEHFPDLCFYARVL